MQRLHRATTARCQQLRPVVKPVDSANNSITSIGSWAKHNPVMSLDSPIRFPDRHNQNVNRLPKKVRAIASLSRSATTMSLARWKLLQDPIQAEPEICLLGSRTSGFIGFSKSTLYQPPYFEWFNFNFPGSGLIADVYEAASG